MYDRIVRVRVVTIAVTLAAALGSPAALLAEEPQGSAAGAGSGDEALLAAESAAEGASETEGTPAPKPATPRRATAGGAEASAVETVTMHDFFFTPKEVTISVGDTVTWRNVGEEPHSATAEDDSFDTGLFGKGKSRSETFEKAGTFAYICSIHPFMKGTVKVRSASGGGDDEGEDTGGTDPSGEEDQAPDSGGGNAEDTSGTGSGEAAPAGESAQPAGSDSTLPTTGLDLIILAELGAILLAAGFVIRQRYVVVAARSPRGSIAGAFLADGASTAQLWIRGLGNGRGPL